MDEAIKIALGTSNETRRKAKKKLAEDLNNRFSKEKEHLVKIEKHLAENYKALLGKETKMKKISA